MLSRNLLFGFVLLNILNFGSLKAQEDTLSMKDSFFRANRFTTGLSGSISTATLKIRKDASGNDVQQEDFTISTRSGYLPIDRLVVGLGLSVTSSGTKSSQRTDVTELLFVGPWVRYYISDNPRGSLYPELLIGFVSAYDLERVVINNVDFDSELKGIGYGVQLGFGFTYALTDNIGFDMTLRYTGIDIRGDRTDVFTGEKISEDFFRDQLAFSFGFQVFINRFFF